jgi:hypothetical protein
VSGSRSAPSSESAAALASNRKKFRKILLQMPPFFPGYGYACVVGGLWE